MAASLLSSGSLKNKYKKVVKIKRENNSTKD